MLFEASIFAACIRPILKTSMCKCSVSDNIFLRRVITTHIAKYCISGKRVFDPVVSLTPLRVERSLVSGVVFWKCLVGEFLTKKFDANWRDIQWRRCWVFRFGITSGVIRRFCWKNDRLIYLINILSSLNLKCENLRESTLSMFKSIVTVVLAPLCETFEVDACESDTISLKFVIHMVFSSY